MSHPRFTKISDFHLDGLPWTFRELRHLKRRDRAICHSRMLDNAIALSEYMGRQDPVEMCYQDPNPDTKSPVCPDETLPQLIFAAMHQGTPVGGIALSDIIIENESLKGIRIQCSPAPCLPHWASLSPGSINGRALAQIIRDPLIMATRKRRRLNVVQMNFPTVAPYRWTSAGRPRQGRMFKLWEKVAVLKMMNRQPQALKSMRRIGAIAPPRIR
jgi:hypothetical protein